MRGLAEYEFAAVGARARLLRRDKGLSRREVARAAGFTTRELAAVERGCRQLTIEDCRSIAGSLGVDLAALAPHDEDFAELSETSHEARIDALLDVRLWDDPDRVLTVEHFAQALPISLSDRERRRDHRTRQRVESTWKAVVNDLRDILGGCEGLTTATSNDDVRQLIDDLTGALNRLHDDRAFRRHLSRHRRLLAKVRRARLVKIDRRSDDDTRSEAQQAS